MLRAVKWGGIFPLLRLPVGALLALALTSFLFRRARSSLLAALDDYHDGLRGGSDVIFQRREFIRPLI